ncbi:MAG: pentapeptide repeat-containing protein [Pseudomonadota bacterium]
MRHYQFLEDLDLIARYDANAEGLDLSGSELKDLRLPGMDFEDANLAGAELEGSDLRNADFEAALLTGADLKFSDLRGAQFDGADLTAAVLDHADLRAADLSEAVGLRPDQLILACFDDTTRLPTGLVPPRRDALACELEDD